MDTQSRTHALDEISKYLGQHQYINPDVLKDVFGRISNAQPGTLVCAFHAAARAVSDNWTYYFENPEAQKSSRQFLQNAMGAELAKIRGNMARLTGLQMSRWIHTFAMLSMHPGEDLFRQWANVLPSKRQELDCKSVRRITESLANLGLYLEGKALESIVARTENLAEDFSSSDLSAILHKLAILDSLRPNEQNSTMLRACANSLTNTISGRLNAFPLLLNDKPTLCQLRNAVLWFYEKEREIEDAPPEGGTISSSEQKLRERFKEVALVPEEDFICRKTGHRFDFSVIIEGKRTLVEYDGPSHFIIKEPGGGFAYDGSTIFQTRLHQGILPGERILRIPYHVHDTWKREEEQELRFLHSLASQIKQAAPGAYYAGNDGQLTPF